MFTHKIMLLIFIGCTCLLSTGISVQLINLNEGNKTTKTILSDMKNAFMIITNNTGVLNGIITKMYDTTVRQIAHTNFVFKLPMEEDEYHQGYAMLSMSRSDFAEPIFPNVTTSDMMKQLKKRRKQQLAMIGSKNQIIKLKLSQPQIHSAQLVQHPHNKDDWSILGLNGWSGAISQPINLIENIASEDDKYPAADILMDFDLSDMDVTTPKQQLLITSSDEEVLEDELNSNIYIARVNDPFGQSTKWEFRNKSVPLQINTNNEDRTKRDVVTLYSMIQCSTGCNPLIYKAYGCYCGFLGAGLPVNGIDRCCKLHDKCYENSNCISYLEYFVPYVWKCYRGKPLCAIDQGEWGGPHSCAARLCQCDLQLSRCLRKFSCPRRRVLCRSSTARQLQNLLLF